MIDIYKVARALIEFFEEDEGKRCFAPTPEWDKLTEEEKAAYFFIKDLRDCTKRDIRLFDAFLSGLLRKNNHR